ncbi:hypothetical protein [Psychrobacter sp.]|uniref:hypothetical protein n=1 Tax=Psychrobacter sp. TaxID=56811 RepID=UPI003564EDF6
MTPTAIDILILLFGCALFMGILIFALTYREIKLKKLTAEQDNKDFVAMRLYRERAKAEGKRQKQPLQDPVLLIMRLHFDELKRQDSQDRTAHNDKTS